MTAVTGRSRRDYTDDPATGNQQPNADFNGRSKSWWIVRIVADLVLVDATSTTAFSTGSLSCVGMCSAGAPATAAAQGGSVLPDDRVGGTTLDPMGEQWPRPRGVARTVRSDKHGSVSVDALVLAFASVIRPLSVAVVYAMLSAPRPTRLLTAYIGAGFVFSTGLGIVLVILLGESAGSRAPDEARAAIAFILGAVSLGYAAGLLSGRFQGPARDTMRASPGPDSNSWLGRQLADLSGPRAALAGVLTHKPGLFYLAALSAIGNSTSSNASRIFQVALYNAIWFAMPVAALALATHKSVELQDFLRRTTEWIWRRQREIMIAAFGLLGAYLIVRGVVELQS
jgi:hypothetical protein